MSGQDNAPSTQAAASTGRQAEALIRVRDLKKYYPIREGVLRRTVGQMRVVDGLTFDIQPGETLALVGEKGNGKSVAGRLILQLEEPTGGQVFYEDRELTAMSKSEIRRLRRHMQMIFRDPYTALNPRLTAGQLVAEPLIIHDIGTEEDRESRIHELLRLVELNPYLANRFPHEFSGGQRVRVGLARALATRPSFIVADDPLSALDRSVQSQLLALLGRLKHRLGLTILYIASDLTLASRIADRIAIIYLGRIVELAKREAMLERPLHPYTQALLSATASDRQRAAPAGEVPSPADPPSGCHFHPRCPHATELCREVYPEWRNLGSADEPHWVACHHAEQFL